MKKRHSNSGLRKVCGCPRRAWAKCRHSWHFAFKWQGVHHRFSLDKHANKHVDNKSDATDLCADLRKAIKAGTFGQPAPVAEMTLRQLADTYLERYVRVEHAATERAHSYQLNGICRTVIPRPTGGCASFGEWRLTDVVTDSVERFREVRRSAGTGAVAVNRYLETLRGVFNWAMRVGYLSSTPFKRGTQTVVTFSDETPRTRRLQDGEEAHLLTACGPHLRAVVECALETGMRLGEILSLQWSQVEGMRLDDASHIAWAPRAELFLPSSKTKTKRDRRIPISTRLRHILEMRRCDPAGQPLPASTYVFGNAIGQRVKSPRRAWYTAVLKSHGHEPTYSKGANLDGASRAALAAINLHFHDLRREAGSRWMDAGVPIATIQRWLGHANVSQTSTYLAGTSSGEHEAMRRFEERRAALQAFATGSKTGGRKSPRSAVTADTRPNKTAVGHEPAVM